jgi:peptidoglycan hydrolase-like protein with peptidoglycan-binding domain
MIAAYTGELRAPFLPLARGTTDGGVRRVQEWLGLHGFTTGIDGEYGPATEAAVRAFQTANGCLLERMAGVVDAVTWGALSAPLVNAESVSSMPDSFGERVCRIARAHLAAKAREVGGDNRGPWVRHYGRGVDQSTVDFFPWCQAFASHVHLKAARELAVPSPFTLADGGGAVSYYVPWVVTQARTAGKFSPGAITSAIPAGSMFFVPGIISGRPSHIHVGIVTADDGQTVTTIEGNGNEAGGSNGYAVVARYRRKAGLDFGLI